MIANELNISTGNITYYFPTKDHLLLEIEKAISSDCREMGKPMLQQFIKHVEATNMQTLENMLRGNRRNRTTDASRLEVSI